MKTQEYLQQWLKDSKDYVETMRGLDSKVEMLQKSIEDFQGGIVFFFQLKYTAAIILLIGIDKKISELRSDCKEIVQAEGSKIKENFQAKGGEILEAVQERAAEMVGVFQQQGILVGAYQGHKDSTRREHAIVQTSCYQMHLHGVRVPVPTQTN